jgi:hypothetical protein
MMFLSVMSVITSPHYFWAIWPDLGMGLILFQAAGRLWADGISIREIFGELPPPTARVAAPVAPSPYPLPAFASPVSPAIPVTPAPPIPAKVPSAAGLATDAVLAGPYGDAVRRAALDRDRVQDLLKQLDAADRATVPNAGATADGLAKQIGTLATALHRIDVETPAAQRPALAERRRVFVEKLESAGMMLQTLYFDLLRLHMSSASSGADGVASVTEQASALSRDIGYLLGAADELRTL